MDTLDAPSGRTLCPRIRFKKDEDGKWITINGQIHRISNSSYFMSDADDKESKKEYLLHGPHRHSLVRRKTEGGERDSYCWCCEGTIIDETYYICSYYKETYHKKCVESPSVFHSSDNPKHPLQLLWFVFFSFIEHQGQCCSCRSFDGKLFYYCSICDFMIHPACATIKSTPLTIDNRKRHEHTLHYLPRKSNLVCDVCALEGGSEYLYICFLCDFIVHKRCVDLPYVIKVSRHDHRLAFTPNLPYKEGTNCGVCHTKINENYGEYSCTKGCVYAMHSRCAMQSDVCDGKELEGEPEETYENTKMYEEKGDGIIQHLSHLRHQMRLENKFKDENKNCQACRRPFYDDGNVYRCMQCDFILHESCAYIPRVKQSMLHLHRLILSLAFTTRWFTCKRCYRYSCGFAYVCPLEDCRLELDTFCASIGEPFDYHSHPHPLFISERETRKNCSICQEKSTQPLYCVTCDFVSCFHCATLPHKARYVYDEHLLTFSYEENANDDELYWCEICEEDINPKTGLYACNECEVTLHVDCLLGKDPYLKPGQAEESSIFAHTLNVLPNTYSTRPICGECGKHCRIVDKLIQQLE